MPAPDGPQWQFVHVPPTESWHDTHQIVAYPKDVDPTKKPESDVGVMNWFKTGGQVSELFVGRDFRRRGVATGMWNEAQRIAQQDPSVPAPRHNPMRSRAGDKWARSVGGELPPLDGGKYTPYYE